MNLSLVRAAALKYLNTTDTGQSTNSLVLQAANLYNTTDRIALNDAVLAALNQYLTTDRLSLNDAAQDAAIQYLAGGAQNGGAINAALLKYVSVNPLAPVNTVAPVVSGTPTQGQTLSCTQGTWSPAGTSYTYQWRRSGVDISGATSATYVLVTADVDENITCTVTATNADGSATATSNSLGPVAAAPTGSTLNPADKHSTITLSNGNLTAVGTDVTGGRSVRSTTSKSTGKWHYEFTVAAPDTYPSAGVANASHLLSQYGGQDATGNSIAAFAATLSMVYRGGVGVGTVEAYQAGDTVAVEVDVDSRQIWFQKASGTRSGPFTVTAIGDLFAVVSVTTAGGQITMNFGATAFAVTPTSGFNAWS